MQPYNGIVCDTQVILLGTREEMMNEFVRTILSSRSLCFDLSPPSYEFEFDFEHILAAYLVSLEIGCFNA